MKNTFLKTIVRAALAILMTAMFAQISVSAQDKIITLEGSWDVQTTPRNCMTGVPMGAATPSMFTFMQGGTTSEFGTRNSPTLRGPSHGIWSRASEFHPLYTSAFQFFRFNADGTHAGRQIVRQQIILSNDGNSFTSSATAQVLDAGGNVISNGCSNGVGTRFE